MMQGAVKHQRGFTLVEIIVVTLLLGIIGVLSFLYIVEGVSAYVTSVENSELAQKAGLAMARINAELIREMAEIDEILPDDSSDKTSIKYAYETNPDAFREIALTGAGDRKQIALVDLATPPDNTDDAVLIDNVSGFTLNFLKYDDSEWVVADGMADLAVIVVTLTLYINDTDTETYTFTTTVAPPKTEDVLTTIWPRLFADVDGPHA